MLFKLKKFVSFVFTLRTPGEQVFSTNEQNSNPVFKGTVSEISSDPPYKDGNVRFTRVKALSVQVWKIFQS